ncbi:l-ascorbate oxidase-like protein [Hordeum vulgare]|nr:l-ascorbate oxidase-like protein [Hordeum vulgare]
MPPPSPGLAPVAAHVGRNPMEFLVQLRRPIRSRLRLPGVFAEAMEGGGPTLWLHVNGCGNGAVPVVAERTRPWTLFLGRGWKSFARAHNLWDRHVLRFKKVAENTLFVKLYGSSGARLGCCEESSSGTESPSSRGCSEEGTGDDDTRRRSGSLQSLSA